VNRKPHYTKKRRHVTLAGANAKNMKGHDLHSEPIAGGFIAPM
jgi:hypothetical protein